MALRPSVLGLFLALSLRLLVRLSAAPTKGDAKVDSSQGTCTDGASCEAHIQNLTASLEAMREEMRGRQLTLQALEDLRTGILSGKRIELPSAQRRHLEKGSPLISEVSFDARHRPVSTNLSRHFQHLRTIAPSIEVRFHTFMPLKRSASGAQKMGPSALVAIVDTESKFSLYNLEGDVVLDRFDLGHGPIVQLALSPNQDNHFVVTSDSKGEIRVHSLKVTSTKEKPGGKKDEDSEEGGRSSPPKNSAAQKRQLVVTANLSASFSIPASPSGEVRRLNSVLPIERGSQIYFVTGDSLGGISVFYRNGTMKGRVKVTEDPNGVKGLMRSQGQMVLFYSSHSFGFFSSTQIDVQYPPCTGWNSPLYDISLDPGFSSSRVVLALSDGDVLVFSTSRGKSKACDLSLKFPHVSMLPFKLHSFRGHVLGLPTPLEDTKRKEDYLREVFFFNVATMDAGYGTAPSRAVALQVSFKPRQPEQLALYAPASTSGNDRGKSQVAMRFVGSRGLELYDLSLKTPPAPKSAGGGEEGGWSSSSWLNWFPKIGIFGIALIGVVMWNVRKVTNQRKHDRMDDFEDDFLKERLRERREKRDQRDKAGEGLGGLGPKDDLGGVGPVDD